MAPDVHPTDDQPVIVYGPPGPDKLKSPFCTVEHKIFSEKLKLMELVLQLGCWGITLNCGGTLSNMVAVEFVKLIVKPFAVFEKLLTLIT